METTYICDQYVQHNGEWYEPSEEVLLTAEEALPLLNLDPPAVHVPMPIVTEIKSSPVAIPSALKKPSGTDKQISAKKILPVE